MNIKIYTHEKRQALKLAKQKVDSLTEIELAKLAKKINVSISTILSYKYGTGNNFETALKIIEG